MAVRQGILDERKKRARERRVKSNAGGEGLRYSQDKMLQLIQDGNVPVQMQHCVLKVYAKAKGSRQDKYLAAFNICAAVFEENGFQKEKSMNLTSKGLKNNRKHQREKNAGSKKAKFKTLTNMTWRNELKQLASE